MKTIAVFFACLVMAGCAADPGSQPNFIQRASVLSKNELSITIEHSERGKPIAFRMADDHCASLKKVAVYGGGNRGSGADTTSTWRCQ